MLTLVQATTDTHRRHYRELLSEYLRWVATYISFDVEPKIEEGMAHSEHYFPPEGCLVIAYDGEEPAGCACMRRIGTDVAELKRMYVRPEHRHKGIGRALMTAIVDEARRGGYRLLRLDSARFMLAAHALYRSAGFREVAPYSESEIPERLRHHWVFMELELAC